MRIIANCMCPALVPLDLRLREASKFLGEKFLNTYQLLFGVRSMQIFLWAARRSSVEMRKLVHQ